jgi:hypothetical protein
MKLICKNCQYYVAYYKQQSSNFVKLNHGHCTTHKKPKGQHGAVCEAFTGKKRIEAVRERLRFKELDRALKSINEIAQILREREKE